MIFYCMTRIDPGYVHSKKNFLGLIERLVDEELHLDYVCVNCEILRPENTMHCNYCNKCIQGFDHHCAFVNNCIGYRNHKYFLLFLFFFTFYMVATICTSIYSLHWLLTSDLYTEPGEYSLKLCKIIIYSYLLFVIVFHSPVLLLQVYSQLRKICRKNPIPDPMT